MEASSDMRLSRIGQVMRRFGKKRSTLYAEVQRGQFPAPVRIGPRQSAWKEEDLLSWEKTLTGKKP